MRQRTDMRREGARARVGWYVLLSHLALCVPCMYSLTGVEARTWLVPDEVPTITEAVQDSAAYADTVLVAAGTYDPGSGEVFPITMADGVVLTSEAGAALTIIDAAGTDRLLECQDLDSTTVLSGFTITGGSSPTDGGGIYCNNSDIRIQDNIIVENAATGLSGCGGGIYCYGATPEIIGNQVLRNTALNWCGGGIYCNNTSALIEDNGVAHNTARYGGGVFNEAASPVITSNIVDGNHALETGGGLDCYSGSSPTLTANVVINNSAVLNGAGIACCFSSSPTVSFNTVAGNVAGYGGGVRPLGGSSPTVIANCIVDNVDGIFLTADSGPVTATDNNLYCNTYQIDGYEVINNTAFTLDLTNNYWWVTDSTEIDSLTYGPGIFVPFRGVPNAFAPGEPSAATSVTVMDDSTYTEPLTGSLWPGATLYIQLEGDDWNPSYIDPALVIITSGPDPYGIGVALIETGTSTGLYRGTAEIQASSDDANNQIGTGPLDTLLIRAFVDPAVCDTVTIVSIGVGDDDVADLQEIEEVCYLHQNHPNPFGGATRITYRVGEAVHTRLEIYNISGQLVRTLIDEPVSSGVHSIQWDGRNSNGDAVRSGIYFYRLQAGASSDSRKMIILR
ncbi:hypothetical protein AMJ71_00975 [candidate division TA06 bacterium SM1_40]|uniref:FlgD Ig-like domain-containing protein n=1 Tax=candidate division TA06 bacterium SM1_40 TaxID=1703773 RepID=A0A0S8JP48_UNCT6|nr:MAG: hypothetical protein AMJ71_00975 [candidate division TA06 bacterium SM1_40]